jgi:hypothetical protein
MWNIVCGYYRVEGVRVEVIEARLFFLVSRLKITTHMRVFENMVLKRIYGPRREEGEGDWKAAQ